ncbi:hypothetical protein D9M68_936940 [compost metagenome]
MPLTVEFQPQPIGRKRIILHSITSPGTAPLILTGPTSDWGPWGYRLRTTLRSAKVIPYLASLPQCTHVLG